MSIWTESHVELTHLDTHARYTNTSLSSLRKCLGVALGGNGLGQVLEQMMLGDHTHATLERQRVMHLGKLNQLNTRLGPQRSMPGFENLCVAVQRLASVY